MYIKFKKKNIYYEKHGSKNKYIIILPGWGNTRKTFSNMIESLKEKYTIVIVTHSMQQAARISDKTAFFLMGELIEFDDTDKIFTNPKDKRTEDYITGRFG